MKNKKIVIAGGSGFMGRSLAEIWGRENQVIILSRSNPGEMCTGNQREAGKASGNQSLATLASQRAAAVHTNPPAGMEQVPPTRYATWMQWDGTQTGPWTAALEDADLLINLSGRSVNCRYNEVNKAEIFRSRIIPTQTLGKAILACKQPPKLWINAGSATIYRHAEDRPMDEYTGEIADDFSVQVCKQWERAFNDITLPNTRKAILRIGVTLGWQNGGVMQPFCNLVKFGLGGHQGSGQQRFTWVHMADVAGMMAWLSEHTALQGVFNCTSPFPVLNKEFMRTLRKEAGQFVGLPAPAWLLKPGAFLIGTETELLLKSRWVVPTRALQEGYTFKYPQLTEAIADILQHMPRRQYHLF
ncbi:TIGR01777 family oxidoreductase [Chitinophaga sp. sic0106]|uniref:TIGR01777 family oxidoreductase n=1 Tax=Chitinophaga sp. sic0106 TaxID=2854785 RepID=UPI001C47F85D|nr:TIGR01777 family oxidoreductase [Chitinophaga sp. sic0106]MBV7532304.1 TIGR01777 family oxidoreductase [Chitinophaga sp. sic0106]